MGNLDIIDDVNVLFRSPIDRELTRGKDKNYSFLAGVVFESCFLLSEKNVVLHYTYYVCLLVWYAGTVRVRILLV